MKKKILIPTDFSVQSLNVLQTFLEQNENQNANFDIVLVHGYRLSDSIMELMFFSKPNILNALVNPEFQEACNVLQNKYEGKINAIKFDIFTGFTQGAFNNYTDANHVDEIYFNSERKPIFSSPRSFDFTNFIKRSNLKVTDVQQGTVSTLFFERVIRYAKEI